MYHITFISTTHKENRNCNSNELCKIIGTIGPDVIFLEALPDTYSKYDEYLFTQYGIFHGKLEIEAIQKYQQIASFKYVPVLNFGMPEAFDRKYEFVTQHFDLQRKINVFNTLASEGGFQFLNSDLSTELQEDMRKLEDMILGDTILNKDAIEAIDTYENSMLEKIFSYSNVNYFKKAIFMCGVAHRKSISDKVTVKNFGRGIKLNWKVLKF